MKKQTGLEKKWIFEYISSGGVQRVLTHQEQHTINTSKPKLS